MEEPKEKTSVQDAMLSLLKVQSMNGTGFKIDMDKGIIDIHDMVNYLDELIAKYEKKLLECKGNCKYPEGRLDTGGKLSMCLMIKTDLEKGGKR